MTYEELTATLMAGDWQRIERDDRLLDIFPTESREKGVELWELQHEAETLLLRVRLPYAEEKLLLYSIATPQLNYLLTSNHQSSLSDFEESAKGAGTAAFL